ncbi:MAG: dynamin family protein, partial [Myxococcota bacterium]
ASRPLDRNRLEPRSPKRSPAALLALGASSDARLYLSRALRLKPSDPEALRVSAWATLAQVDYDPEVLRQGHHTLSEEDAQWVHGAEAQFMRLRQIQPSRGEALYGLGRCRMLRGDGAGARRFLTMAVALDDGDRAVLDLAATSAQIDAPAEAVATVTGLLKMAATPETRGALTAILDRLYTQLVPGIALPPRSAHDIAALSEAAHKFHDWIAQTPRLHRFLKQARAIVEALDAPLDVAIVGEFNAGKSTLVNAFIGEAVVPTGVLPTTAHIHVMRFGPRRTAQLHLQGGGVEEVAFPDVRKRLRRRGDEAISHIEYLYPHPELRRVHIWDTPGLNSPNAAHEAHARKALSQAEVIFWVCDASQALSDSEKARIDTIDDPSERLVVLINKIDRLGEPGNARDQAVAQVRTHISEALGEGVKGIFALSGLDGLKARVDGDDEALEHSGLGPLLRFAESEVFDRAARLKASVSGRQLEALAQELDTHGRHEEERLGRLLKRMDALREGLDAEEHNVALTLAPQERDRLVSGIDFLLLLVAREVSELMHPTSRFIDALLTRRTQVEPEDVEFVLELMVERFGDLLHRSEERVHKELLEVEQRFVDSVDALAELLAAQDAKRARRRLESYLNEARTLRLVLGQHVYGRYKLIAEGRATSPEVDRLIARQAALPKETPEEARKAALRALLPLVSDDIEARLGTWAKEYFNAARKFCDLLQGDLDVLKIEAAALSRVLVRSEQADGEAPVA